MDCPRQTPSSSTRSWSPPTQPRRKRVRNRTSSARANATSVRSPVHLVPPVVARWPMRTWRHAGLRGHLLVPPVGADASRRRDGAGSLVHVRDDGRPAPGRANRASRASARRRSCRSRTIRFRPSNHAGIRSAFISIVRSPGYPSFCGSPSCSCRAVHPGRLARCPPKAWFGGIFPLGREAARPRCPPAPWPCR